MKAVSIKQFISSTKSQTIALSRIFSKKVDSFLVIEIGSKLTILSVSVKNGLKINAFKSIPLLKEKRDESILAAIKDFIRENKIEHKKAILNPSLESVVIKRIQIAAVPDSELLDAIKWQIKDDFTFDIANAVIDYSIIKKTAKEDGSRLLDIICIAAKDEDIKQQILLLKNAGLDCLAVNIAPFGYLKIFEQDIKFKSAAPVAVLNIDNSGSYLSIYKNNKLEFYRELPVSVDKLRDSLKGILATETGKVELSSQEIDEILSNTGIPLENSVYKNKINFIQILSLMRPVLERLIIEIKRSLSYYDTEYSGGMVDKVLIAGGALRIPNLDKFLAKELGFDVENLFLSEGMAISSGVNKLELSENYANLGLVFDYEREANLLPFEFRSQRIENVEKVSLRWIVFLAILLLAMSFIFTKARIGILSRSLNNAKFHLGALSLVKEISGNLSVLDNFISGIKRTQAPVDIILKKLSNLAGRELFFSQLSMDIENMSGSVNGFVRTINQNPDAILTEFISAMKSSGYFRDASISRVSKENKEGNDIAVFNIKFKLN